MQKNKGVRLAQGRVERLLRWAHSVEPMRIERLGRG